jgi:hypothetical protein
VRNQFGQVNPINSQFRPTIPQIRPQMTPSTNIQSPTAVFRQFYVKDPQTGNMRRLTEAEMKKVGEK